MKKLFRALALLLLIGALITWLVTGACLGWTKTSVAVKQVDPVTGIEGITYEKKFVAGVDFLGAALFSALVLTGVSCLFRSKSNVQTNN